MAAAKGNPPSPSSAETVSVASFFQANIFRLLFLLGAFYFFYYALHGWNGSLLEAFSFRQTQTAISVQYMVRGGPLLGYETPVLGPPWSIPFEFPIYQYLVAAVTALTGYGLDQSGRLVSLLSFISLLYPLYVLTAPLFTDRSRAYIALLLLCISPQYLYWSRTFMIESTALALALWYLYGIKKQLDAPANPLLLAFTLVVGVIAAITKVTTFFAFYLIAALVLLLTLGRQYRQQGRAAIGKQLPLLIVALGLPLLSIFFWTHYTDQLKELNPLGAKLTSSALKTWNFGTWQQKLSVALWKRTLYRSLTDLAGNVWLFVASSALLPFCRRRTIGLVLLLALLFLLPMAVFFNLYMVHGYYVYANGILLLVAVALIIGDLSSRGLPRLLAAFCLLLAFGFFSGKHYLHSYYPLQGNGYRYQDMKYYVDLKTKPDDLLVFFGADWSSELPYYLGRRAVMFPESLTTAENYRRTIDNIRSYPLGGVFLCDEYRLPEKKFRIMTDFSAFLPIGLSATGIGNCDIYFTTRGATL